MSRKRCQENIEENLKIFFFKILIFRSEFWNEWYSAYAYAYYSVSCNILLSSSEIFSKVKVLTAMFLDEAMMTN